MEIRGSEAMRNEFMAVVERDGPWHIAYCPEIPGANGQGKTKSAAVKSLAEAIALILQDRRKDEKLWLDEAERRLSELQSGKVPGIPAERVSKKARSTLR